jgi:hypothetical protein
MEFWKELTQKFKPSNALPEGLEANILLKK